jgi:hypothetical protein
MYCHVPSCTAIDRDIILDVPPCTTMYHHVLPCTVKDREMRTNTNFSVIFLYRYVPVCTVMYRHATFSKLAYRYVLYKRTYWYVQVRTSMYHPNQVFRISDVIFWYILSCTHKQWSQPFFTSNQALFALRGRRVSQPRSSLSSHAAFFLSAVAVQYPPQPACGVRPPRRGFPRG